MIVAEKNVATSLALDENVPSGLDWQAFSAAYFPESRRHNLRAIVAYGAYRRSSPAGHEQASGAARHGQDAIRSEAVSVETWEDEGGASIRLPRLRETQHSA
jgi:hypothetical protein